MQEPELPPSSTGHLLPQSFLERDVMVNVQYELTLTIVHGRFSTKSRVNTPIIYAPVTVPSSMTLGRQRAYRQRQIPPSPDLDPGGWKQLPPASIRGTFNDRTTLTVNYTLSLATPQSYARVIPCYLTISCDDVGALNLFADPRTPRVRLRRSTRVFLDQPLGAEATGHVSGLSVDHFQGGVDTPIRPKLPSAPLRLAQRKENRSQPATRTDSRY
ncbi:hypothetical protein FA13DRAFT_1082671 [Coprinellus micaceus]|uniref:Arrestin-like N-terminal domain-containing protein n=1 Tax=Coprinellus micaceus TaxID=71717 RepID=A0A4Y7TRY9_COPMI|nr:hypothetical protein FA13DRAFT_1082671 [Coprinellus micaceus]